MLSGDEFYPDDVTSGPATDDVHVSAECMSRGHWDANGSGDWHCIHEPCACLPVRILDRDADGFTAIIGGESA